MCPVKEFDKFLGVHEIKEYKMVIKQLICEFFGVFLFVFLSVLASTNFTSGVLDIAFANGLLIATIVQLIGHVSGGHINPAITVGVMIAGQIKVLKALCYIVAQIFGSIAGAAVSYYSLSTELQEVTRGLLGVTLPSDELTPAAACGLELIMTFLLVAIVLSVTDIHRSAKGLGSAPLAIGLTVIACQCSCVLYTGSLNPARSFGPAVLMNSWSHHWVYWVGPILGAVFSGLVFKYVLSSRSVVAIE